MGDIISQQSPQTIIIVKKSGNILQNRKQYSRTMWMFSCLINIHFAPKTVFSIPRSNGTSDAIRMRPFPRTEEFPDTGTRRLATSTSRSAKRTQIVFRASSIFISHQNHSFVDPPVERDHGREPDAAQSTHRRIPRLGDRRRAASTSRSARRTFASSPHEYDGKRREHLMNMT